tara:strand:+ start:564 stop:1241 length:678 start_codon:yes stop_codon:yes gene_type:complete
MKSVGNSGSALVFTPEPFSVYLDAVRFKAPGAEVFAPMRFDTDSLIYMAFALEFIVAEVLELAGSASRDEKEDIISTRRLIAVVNSDEELRQSGTRFGWELLFAPERAIMREEELRLSDIKDRIMMCDGVVRTLALLVGREDDGDVYDCDDYYKYTPGVIVSKAWNTIFENEAKTQLESDEVRCHTKVIFASPHLTYFTIIYTTPLQGKVETRSGNHQNRTKWRT